MPREAAVIGCDEATRRKLEKIANSQTEEVRLAQRAQLVLACLSGDLLQNIAEENKVQKSTVIKWRNRFSKSGVAGLQDEPRSGKPKTYSKDFEAAVLAVLEESPPNGMAKWDGPAVAKRLNTSVDAVWRLLRKLGICLSRQRTWCISTDPHFVAKAADIVGLYLNPPQKAHYIIINHSSCIDSSLFGLVSNPV